MYDAYVKSGSTRKVKRRFRRKFQDVTVPHRKTIHRIVNKVRQTGSLMDRKPKHKRRVLTEEKLDEIGARLEETPWKTLRRLAQETGISESSARTATKLLCLSNYICIVMQVTDQSVEVIGSNPTPVFLFDKTY
jgi:transposase